MVIVSVVSSVEVSVTVVPDDNDVVVSNPRDAPNVDVL